jgi:hypothetical protein
MLRGFKKKLQAAKISFLVGIISELLLGFGLRGVTPQRMWPAAAIPTPAALALLLSVPAALPGVLLENY